MDWTDCWPLIGLALLLSPGLFVLILAASSVVRRRNEKIKRTERAS